MNASSVVFSPSYQAEVRRSPYENTIPCGAPFEQANGDVQVLGYERQVFFSGPDRVEKCQDAPKKQGWSSWSGFGTQAQGPESQPGTFEDDGTVFFATNQGVLRGVREAREVFSTPAGGKVSTPVVFDRTGRLVYGLESGHIRVVGRDGRVFANVPVDTAPEKPERLRAVLPLPDGGFLIKGTYGYECGYQGRIARVAPDGRVAWSRPYHFAEDMEDQLPTLSPDQSTVYVGGVLGRFLALRADTGEDCWALDLGGDKRFTTARPVIDAEGSVCLLSSDGRIHRLDAGGAPVHPAIDTRVRFFHVNHTPASLVVDAAGDICAAPDWSHFMVFDRVGREVASLEGKDLFFHSGDYIHAVSLSRDGEKAFVLGSSTLATVTLPPPLARVAEAAMKQAESRPAPTLERSETFVVINGVRVPVREPQA